MSEAHVTSDHLVLYAMNLLDAQQTARMQRLLEHSTEARQELARIHADLSIFAMGTDMRAVPASVKQRVMKTVGREPKTVALPPPVPEPPPPTSVQTLPTAPPQAVAEGEENAATQRVHDRLTLRSFEDPPAAAPRRLVVGWSGWVLAAGLGVATGALYHQNRALHTRLQAAQSSAETSNAIAQKAEAVVQTMDSATAQRFLLTKTDAQPIPMARVSYVPETGSLIFQGSNLDPLPTAKTYELWLIPVGEKREPVPAGLFKPDARGFASVVLPDLPKGLVASKFGVTIEDEGGAAQPHGNILLIGS